MRDRISLEIEIYSQSFVVALCIPFDCALHDCRAVVEYIADAMPTRANVMKINLNSNDSNALRMKIN
jgi:hypothetical protein